MRKHSSSFPNLLYRGFAVHRLGKSDVNEVAGVLPNAIRGFGKLHICATNAAALFAVWTILRRQFADEGPGDFGGLAVVVVDVKT